MNLFLTDSSAVYEGSREPAKLFIEGPVVVRCSFASGEELRDFNREQNAFENECAEALIPLLLELSSANHSISCNPWLSTRDKAGQAYSLLYPNFKTILLPSMILERTLERFLKWKTLSIGSVSGSLSSTLQLADLSRATGGMPVTVQIRTDQIPGSGFLKNLALGAYRLLAGPRRPDTGRKLHIALFMYDTPNDISLFRHFFEKVNAEKDIYLSIVQLSSGIPPESRQSASEFASANISWFGFESFRSPVKFRNDSFYDWAEKKDPRYSAFRVNRINERNEVYYAYADQALTVLRPDVVMYNNTGEAGRVITDVARFHKTPSVNVEYGLFSDDAIHMESNILFSARACLGTASAELWKKRHDPTPIHRPVGFLKLDSLPGRSFGPVEIKKKYGIPEDKPVLFFASTWAGTNKLYEQEKQRIAILLAEICIKNNYKLIVKKHPAEQDDLIREALKTYEGAEVFSHAEIDLHEAIAASDILLTQLSGVTVEALYHRKPVIFYNESGSGSMAGFSLMKNESFVFILNDPLSLEKKISELIRQPLPPAIYEAALSRYLYKTDGMAWRRLLDLCRELA